MSGRYERTELRYFVVEDPTGTIDVLHGSYGRLASQLTSGWKLLRNIVVYKGYEQEARTSAYMAQERLAADRHAPMTTREDPAVDRARQAVIAAMRAEDQGLLARLERETQAKARRAAAQARAAQRKRSSSSSEPPASEAGQS